MSELRTDEHGRTVYQIDGAVLTEFMQSTRARANHLRPGRQRQSKACNLKLWAIANAQKPGPDGIRRTRMAVVRTTYPEFEQQQLERGSIRFPKKSIGPLKWTQPPSQKVTWGDVVWKLISSRSMTRPTCKN